MFKKRKNINDFLKNKYLSFRKGEFNDNDLFDYSQMWQDLEERKTKEHQKNVKRLSLNVDLKKLKEVEESKDLDKTINDFCIPFIKDKKNKKIYYWSIFISLISRILLHGFYLTLFALIAYVVYESAHLRPVYGTLMKRRLYIITTVVVAVLNFPIAALIFSGFKKSKVFKGRSIIGIATANIAIYRETKKLIKKYLLLVNDKSNDADKENDPNKINKQVILLLVNQYFHVNLLDTFFLDKELTNDSVNNLKASRSKSINKNFKICNIYNLYEQTRPLLHMFVSTFIYAGIAYLIYLFFLR
ncbi:hypothetical protein D8X55_00955 [Malacoplasma penetrans]|uniref:Uncharacterized protein n=1 Tax=Malacoplasma penetrans (strain HF-2) TaxID=272633 RepID=Q8EVU6_MALP2|nr:hypothetical protein [Malacoplasma penetrans]RXY97253.1 hypothetical protein D8X55_00955 [Malacoplasma penetrans]BAC44253.1 hypothetical protein [Malacoplasma penetrans HF-2]